jgi:hypothetical protein
LIITNHLVHLPEPPITSHLNGSKSVDDAEPNSVQSQIRHNIYARVPKRHFSIKNKSYKIVIQDEEEHRNIRETLIYPAKEKYMKTIEEEMRSNNI